MRWREPVLYYDHDRRAGRVAGATAVSMMETQGACDLRKDNGDA